MEDRYTSTGIYLDHAATTPLDPEVLEAMMPYLTVHYANPSSLYASGRVANAALHNSRRTIARILGTLPDTIIFTSGGTESNNLAIFGLARQHRERPQHIVTTAIEHHSVSEPLADLQHQGWQVTYVPTDSFGLVDPEAILSAVRPETVLVSVMYVNNEIGSIEPIADIGKKLSKYRREHESVFPYFHTDACQAACYLDLSVDKLHVDLMTVNGSKIYGPKGSGLLYVRRGVPLRPLVLGGKQERQLRAGTENVAGIVGLARALELCASRRQNQLPRLAQLSQFFLSQIQNSITRTRLNGPPVGAQRLSSNLNMVIEGIDAQALVLYLDEQGIMCSTGSACTAGSKYPSPVLQAIGLPDELARSSVRFSMGHATDEASLVRVASFLPDLVERLRLGEPNQVC